MFSRTTNRAIVPTASTHAHKLQVTARRYTEPFMWQVSLGERQAFRLRCTDKHSVITDRQRQPGTNVCCNLYSLSWLRLFYALYSVHNRREAAFQKIFETDRSIGGCLTLWWDVLVVLITLLVLGEVYMMGRTHESGQEERGQMGLGSIAQWMQKKKYVRDWLRTATLEKDDTPNFRHRRWYMNEWLVCGLYPVFTFIPLPPKLGYDCRRQRPPPHQTEYFKTASFRATRQ